MTKEMERFVSLLPAVKKITSLPGVEAINRELVENFFLEYIRSEQIATNRMEKL